MLVRELEATPVEALARWTLRYRLQVQRLGHNNIRARLSSQGLRLLLTLQ